MVLGLRRRYKGGRNGGTGVSLIYLAAPGHSEADIRLLTLPMGMADSLSTKHQAVHRTDQCTRGMMIRLLL